MLFPRDAVHNVVDKLSSTHTDTVALKFVPSGPMRGSRGQNHRAVAETNEVNKATHVNILTLTVNVAKIACLSLPTICTVLPLKWA